MMGGPMPACLHMSKGGLMAPLDLTTASMRMAREAMRANDTEAGSILYAFFSGARGAASPPRSG
jgi:hypothetical protein